MSSVKYRAVVQVALSGSLTKAAGIMGYSQPGISHMISSLENEYGFSIFHRNRDICTLTENGKQVLHYCSQIIKYENYLQDTIHSLNGLLSGSIRISSISSMLVNFVPKVIQRFSSTYSNIDIQVKERTFEQIYSDLQDGFSDIAFTNDKVDKSFDFISLLKDPVCLIMPPGHPFSKYEKVPVDILNGCDFIMPIQGFDDVYRIITEKVSIRPNVKYQVGSDIAVIGMVANHLGISVLSKRQTKLLSDKIVVKEFCEGFYRTLGIAVKSRKHAPPAIKEFISVACANVKPVYNPLSQRKANCCPSSGE